MDQITTVVNIRTDKCDVKICRTPSNKISDYPGPGWAGNPFFLRDVNNDAERKNVIDKYRQYFYTRLANDENFKRGILSLKGKKLGCFCAPKFCHGHVIANYLENEI